MTISLVRLSFSGAAALRARASTVRAEPSPHRIMANIVGKLMPGDWVTVLPAAEIAETLDADGCLEGLPFMPEMAAHCGKAFQVHLRAEHTCTFPYVGHRRLEDAVVLQSLRCNGAEHGGCQLGCMMFWKEAWLRRVGDHAATTTSDSRSPVPAFRARRREDPELHICQGTELVRATTPGASKYDPKQYVGMVRSRTLTLRELAGLFTEVAGRKLQRKLRRFHSPPAKQDSHPVQPALGLRPGDVVTIRSRDAVRATLDAKGRLRGLLFAETMYVYCGRTMKVAALVEQIIDERTGKLRRFGPGTVLLENGICDRYRGCARNLPIMWREDWLELIERAPAEPTPGRSRPPAAWLPPRPVARPGPQLEPTTTH